MMPNTSKSAAGRHIVALASAAVMALLLCAGGVRATTVLKLTLEQLVAGSELIFTGTVVDVASAAEGDLVYTTVRFAVEDVVKGEASSGTIELRFLGGASGELRTDVSEQYIPAEGARGLWFIDDTLRALVNPLTGWSQGHFPLVAAADGSQWLDLKDHPDYGLLQENPDPLAAKMRGLQFTREQIAEQFPERLRYPLDDFIRAIDAVIAEQGE
jgi:hypothetical protein